MRHPGSIWISGDTLHYTRGDGNEYAMSGTRVGTEELPDAAIGSVWVDGDDLRFVSEFNYERSIASETGNLIDGAEGASLWVEGSAVHWVSENGNLHHSASGTLQNGTGLEGSIWIDGTWIHYINANREEYRIEGSNTGIESTSFESGAIYLGITGAAGRKRYFFFIDEFGTRRLLPIEKTSHTVSDNAVRQSFWVDTNPYGNGASYLMVVLPNPDPQETNTYDAYAIEPTSGTPEFVTTH